MASSNFAAQSVFFQHLSTGYAGSQDSRLSIKGQTQLIFRTIKTHIADGETQSFVSSFKNLASASIVIIKIFTHTYSLGTLSREYKCNFAHWENLSFVFCSIVLAGLFTPFKHNGRPCEASTETNQQYCTAFFKYALLLRLAQGNGNGSSGSIAVFIDIYPNFFHWHFQTFSSTVNNADISLMRNQKIDISRFKTCFS